MHRWKATVLGLLLVWQGLLSLLLTLAGTQNRLLRGLTAMLWGLNLGWIGGAGAFTLVARKPLRRLAASLPGPAELHFIAGATLMALLEEALATTLTRCAPLFGYRLGEVYITASADYLDVVTHHSVVVFIPQFAAWSWLLRRYRFSPFAVFLLFGMTGWINETLFAGANPLALAQWILIYGLMVYLPAYCHPGAESRRPVRGWHIPLALFLPIAAALPVVALVHLLAPEHPRLHFPPMGSPG